MHRTDKCSQHSSIILLKASVAKWLSVRFQTWVVIMGSNHVTLTEIPVLFRCYLLLFECLFEFVLVRVVIAISFSAHIPSRWAFSSSTFFVKLSARQSILETMILLFCFYRFCQSYHVFRNLFRWKIYFWFKNKYFWFKVSLSLF